MGFYRVHRYHDISCGHRVVGHENKCRHLHGHNYRVHFTVAANQENVEQLDGVGRVLDFSVIKTQLCAWLEDHWDHRFLMWDEDPWLRALEGADEGDSVVRVPFNPTAENMARYLIDVVGPAMLEGSGCLLVLVTVDETRKCSATYALPGW